MKTVAPNENINQIPVDVLKVRKASVLITKAADIPDITASIFLDIFIFNI